MWKTTPTSATSRSAPIEGMRLTTCANSSSSRESCWDPICLPPWPRSPSGHRSIVTSPLRTSPMRRGDRWVRRSRRLVARSTRATRTRAFAPSRRPTPWTSTGAASSFGASCRASRNVPRGLDSSRWSARAAPGSHRWSGPEWSPRSAQVPSGSRSGGSSRRCSRAPIRRTSWSARWRVWRRNRSEDLTD